MKKLSESRSRLFRKKRKQLVKRTKLQHISKVKGVYFFPFKNPKPSQKEIEEFGLVRELIREFNVGALYFCGTLVRFYTSAEGDPFGKNGSMDPSRIKIHFVIEPIKVPMK